MKKVLSLILSLNILFCCLFCNSACVPSINQNRDKKVMINDINYNSLSEAVKNAKDGDKIEIHNDISDNKNIIITKSISIIGKPNSSNIKPKLYGSITIDANEEDSFISIENIEIINSGKSDENPVNNTLYAINLIDGGLNLKNCKIFPSGKQIDNNACGLVISRKINSINTMPIIISGNQFGGYPYNDKLNSAVLIKSNKNGQFKNLYFNDDLLQNSNTFDHSSNCNNIIKIDYSSETEKYPFVMTSSASFMINCFKNNRQTNIRNNYILVNAEDFPQEDDEPLYILSSTHFEISGTKPLDMQNTTFKVSGSVFIDTQIKNATFERMLDTSCILFGKSVDKNKVEII